MRDIINELYHTLVTFAMWSLTSCPLLCRTLHAQQDIWAFECNNTKIGHSNALQWVQWVSKQCLEFRWLPNMNDVRSTRACDRIFNYCVVWWRSCVRCLVRCVWSRSIYVLLWHLNVRCLVQWVSSRCLEFRSFPNKYDVRFIRTCDRIFIFCITAFERSMDLKSMLWVQMIPEQVGCRIHTCLWSVDPICLVF